MNAIYLLSFILTVGLSACGQTGPLYLPKDAPKVYDEPSPQAEEDNKEKATKPEPPPLPEKSAPKSEKSEPQPETTAPESEKSVQTPVNSEPNLENPVLLPEKTEPAPEK